MTSLPTLRVSPSKLKSRHVRGRLLSAGSIAVGVLGVVLIVLGTLAFSSASSARDDAHRLDGERRSLAARERATQEQIQSFSSQGRNVGDQIDQLVAAGNQLVSGANALGSVLEQADAKYNAGDEHAAAADVDSRGRPTLNEVQVLADRESQSLTEAHDAERKLREGL
jgi:type II secretory pathway pseudopilin PulG